MDHSRAASPMAWDSLAKRLCSLLVSVCSLAVSVSTICLLVDFLSSSEYLVPPTRNKGRTLACLLTNTGLVALFMLQHSVMKTERMKGMVAQCGVHFMFRTLYVTGTNACILTLVYLWEPVPIQMWSLDTEKMPHLMWVVKMVHYSSWFLIYCSTLMLDIPDILGVKQIYTYIMDATVNNDPELERLYSHMRHPSFSLLTLILWLRPVMTLDRLILALLLTTFMYLRWRPDQRDLDYQSEMWRRKKKLLSQSNRI